MRDALSTRAIDFLLTRERREHFSVHPEVRICAWLGAMLLATAAGIVLKNNFERIGPIGIAALVAILAAGCYVWTWRRRTRSSIADDSVLLLGALLLSADVAFIESQFHLLGDAWYRHFLIVAVAHGIGAYLYNSRALLTLSIVALAAWMGIEQSTFHRIDAQEFSLRCIGMASLLGIWWRVNRRSEFTSTLELFFANFLLLAFFANMFEERTRLFGCGMTIVSAMMVMRWGFRTRRESFVLFAFVYAVIAVDVLLVDLFSGQDAVVFLVLLVSSIAAIIALIFIHARFRELADAR